jgi:hypothetical protein
MGVGEKQNSVYVIDFGLAIRYRNSQTGRHIAMKEHKELTGTARYASVAAMRGLEQSRRDDLESLGYVWMYLLRGSLPWQGLPAKNNAEKMAAILALKKSTSAEELCRGFPAEFVDYFQIVRKLRFDEGPDYGALKQMFRDLFVREKMVFDYDYDWGMKKVLGGKGFPEIPQQRFTQPSSVAVTPRDGILGRLRGKGAVLKKPQCHRQAKIIGKQMR